MSFCCKEPNIDLLLDIKTDKFQISKKSCGECNKEFALCFCNLICNEITSSKRQHEYLVCINRNCNFLGVRCLFCNKLCSILYSSNSINLFWGCFCTDKSFKEWLDKSLR